MAECAQDPEWHAEGDVWTHTRRVCGELERLDEWDRVAPTERAVLLFAALLHDSAKPLTSRTDPETGRVTSPNHAVRGEHLARNVLRDLGCDLGTRERIAKLVRYHGRPTFLFERDDPEAELIRLSWLTRNDLLYLLAVADYRGRDTDAQTRPEDVLHLFRLAADEGGCLRKPYPFVNDTARLRFFRAEHPDTHHIPHEEFACRITMVSGLPGSGKDHWVTTRHGDAPTVSMDDMRDELEVSATDDQGTVVQAARERCRELLRSRTDFVFNATNLVAMTRRRWIDLFLGYGARVDIVYIEPPLELILQRNRTRSRVVPEGVIRRLASKVEPPAWDEAHGVTHFDGEKEVEHPS
jgi:predicted kinase